MVWTFAQAIQEQAERLGAYAGIAAFFGLALLAILYFAQARELKRLRDWAGRAPERARELEERVMGQTATGTSTPVETTPAVAPAPVLGVAAPGPAAAAVATGAGPGAAPAPPGASGPDVSNGAPAAGPSHSDAAAPAETAPPSGSNGSGENAAIGARPAQDGDASPQAEDGGTPSGEDSAAPAPEPSGDQAPPDREPGAVPAEPPTVVAPAATGGEDAPAEPSRPLEDSIGEAAIPAAARAIGPGASPRPATAAALRVSRPSATSPRASATPPRRPAPSRPLLSEPPRRRRSAGFMAMAGVIALLVLGGAAFAISSLGGDDEAPREPNRADVTDPGTSAPEPEATPDVTTSRGDTSVVVLNGTAITGLAAEVSQQLSQSGYPEGQTANYTGAQREESVVLYREGFAEQARDVGELLEVSRIESMQGEAQAEQLEGAEVVVIAGHDQAP